MKLKKKMVMKLVIYLTGCSFCLCIKTQSVGQSRLAISAGASASFGGNFNTFNPVGRLNADLEWDKKILGSLHVVTGLSTFGVGYSSSDSIFGSYRSKFKSQYVGIPVMARWNIGNRNFAYVDMGFIAYYLVYAHLTESIDKHRLIETYDGNITPYLNKLFVGFKVQFGFSVNRFTISEFFIYQFKGQEMINNLGDHWGANVIQSTFLSSNGYSDFRAFGVRLGYRIR